MLFRSPLKEISFGKVLLRLFETSRAFNMQIQPQLVLLQKTLLNIEGLGRELDPDLDLWKTAKPYLERWMNEQIGVRGLIKNIRQESTNWASMLPQLPSLTFNALKRTEAYSLLPLSLYKISRQLAWQNILLSIAIGLLGLVAFVFWLKL